MTAFPEGYCLKKVREAIQNDFEKERLYGRLPSVNNCTNAWIDGKGFEDIKKSVLTRGTDPRFFYNCFYRINGAEDKLTYANELFQLQLELKNAGRKTDTG